jgi:8-oxo-dGTP pyrophosphatase MutT (NUDIX family)
MLLRWAASGQHTAVHHRSRVAMASTQASAANTEAPQPPPRYRPNVGICVFNSKGQVFAAQRLKDTKGEWQMPQGGIDPGEDAAEAALRELQEETSVRSVRIVSRINRWLTYDFPPEVKAKLYGQWQNYDGQTQLWFLLRFEGDDAEVNLDVVVEHKEFKAWRWMPLEDLPSKVIGFKQGVYEQVVKEFAPVIKQHVASS